MSAASADRELLPTATSRQSWRALLTLLRPHRATAIVAAVVLVLASTAGVVAPLLLGDVVNRVTDGQETSDLVLPIAGLAALAVLAGILDFLGPLLVAKIGEPAVADLREDVVGRAMSMELSQLEHSGTGDVLSRVTEDVQLVKEATQGLFTYFASAALTIAATLVGLAALDWRFLLAGLLALPVHVFALRRYLGQASSLYAGERVARGALAQQELDSIGGARTVRAFGIQNRHADLVSGRSLASIDYARRAVRMRTTFFARLNAAEFVGLSAVLVAGYQAVRTDSVSIGAATAAALMFVRLFDPINIVLGLVDDMQEAAAGLARLVGVTMLDRPRQQQLTVPREPRTSGVVVDDLTFSYVPGHPVLTDVTLTIAAGERLAVVGTSGAGKSTLATVIAGTRTRYEGSVEISGDALDSLAPAERNEHVALVTQEVHVFSGTVADNLRLGRPSATDEDLWAALDIVKATDWARGLAEGLDTEVGAGAQRLTATEAQLLALARLALVDPDVVVLDEATAEAGSAGARTLEASAAGLLTGRSALIVAHRLSQAVAADRILVLEHGRIVQNGTHDGLTRVDGPYARLWEAWNAHRRS